MRFDRLAAVPYWLGDEGFTAALVGMLVDEGRMQWDDPVEKYLPEFKPKVQSNDRSGRMIVQVEHIEVGVKLARDTFTLEPPTESGPGK